MRLYHSRLRGAAACNPIEKSKGEWLKEVLFLFCLIPGLLLAGCTAPAQTAAGIQVVVSAEGVERTVSIPKGSSVHKALTEAGISLGPLDYSEPAIFTVLNDSTRVRVVRVREEFEIVDDTIPFQNQVLRNESMPEGETRLVQPGVNGLQEITYRRVYEDNSSVSYIPVKVVVLKEPVPEIVMVGSQAPFASFTIPGRLVYLLGGNAWVIERNTANRRPFVTTGDLDGRIFSLSPDGMWLLFTRAADHGPDHGGDINQLWAARLPDDTSQEVQLVDLNVTNVVHFADWKPGSAYHIAYSTVEPRSSAPGWQANNDLKLLQMSSSGQVRHLPVQLETNMGGNYGWWGIQFAWSPDGSKIAYARPDGVGLLEEEEGNLVPYLELVSLQTKGDWAWVPGLSWGMTGNVLFTVEHVSGPGAISHEESPYFDLAAVPLEGGNPVRLVSSTGMFTYPLASPVINRARGEKDYLVAYLQAVFPAQSETSRYHLVIIDRDGSNRRVLFPPDGSQGITPQAEWGVWSPAVLEDTNSLALAVLYQDNLWLVDAETGSARQLTGDDLISKVDWK